MPIFRNFVLTLSALAFLHTGAVGCAAQNLEERILWDAEEKYATFLPQSVIRDQNLAELPLHDEDADFIRQIIEVRDETSVDKPLCYSLGSVSPPGSRTDAAELEDLIREEPVAVVGRVVDTVFGWNTQTGQTAHMIYLWIKTVLNDDGKKLQRGDLAAYAISGGEIFFGNAEVCFESREDVELPEVGQEFLLIGNFWPDNEPPYVASQIVLPVENGSVKMLPHPRLLTQKDRSLRQLRQEVRTRRGNNE